MQCLWVGHDDGVSRPLLESFRDAGASVTVLVRRSDAGPERLPGVEWRQIDSKARRGAGSLLSRSPRVAHVANTTSLRLGLAEELDREPDVVVLDGMGAGWALPQLRVRHSRVPFVVVHVSHRHERTTAWHAARAGSADAIRRALRRHDARKVGFLELATLDAADVVTAPTEVDADGLRADAPGTPVLVRPSGAELFTALAGLR